mgnify:CR=1 FL=1
MPPTPPMFCRVCQQPLDTRGDYDNQGFMINVHHEHPEWYEADHEPDPALIEDYTTITNHCDFCLAPIHDGGWTYPANDFSVMVEIAPGRKTDYGSAGDWCACDACHKDIETARWEAMVERSATYQGLPAHQKPGIRSFMLNLWTGFENHRTGPAYHEMRKKAR